MSRNSTDGTGNVSLLKNTKVTEWNFNYGGYIAIAFGGLILLGCVTAYVIAVARGNVDAVLPLISDAAGSPPQNGLFGTFICFGGMFGVAFMLLRYMIVLDKNCEKSSLVTTINQLSLFIGIISMLGITLVTGYPINFYRNRDVWLMDVGIPHMIGGVMLFAFGLVYIALQCILTLFFKIKNKSTLLIRILLLFICTTSFIYHVLTVPDNFGGISHLYYTNMTDNSELNITNRLPYPSTMGSDLKLPIDTSGTYIASSISEWIFVIAFCCFFFTFFNEAQQYSLLIVIETHATDESEVIEDTKAEIRRLSLAVQNTSLVDTKPPPESRKFLRRDSTCQTPSDGINTVESKQQKDNASTSKKYSAQKFPAKINAAKKILANAQIDEKLKRILRDKDGGKNGVHKQSKTSETGTSCDDLSKQNGEKYANKTEVEKEAERIAIEKIDVVVKDAEKRAEEILKNNHEEDGTSKKSDNEYALPSVCSSSIQ